MKKTNLVTIIDVNTVEQHATKNENKYKKLQTFGLGYSQCKSTFNNDGSQNNLVFLPFYIYFKNIGDTNFISAYISKRLSHEIIRSPDSSNNILSPAKSCKKTVKLTKNAYTDKYKYSA